MKFLLCLFFVAGGFSIAHAKKPVEIYSGGNKYDSVESYQFSKESQKEPQKLKGHEAKLDSTQEDYIRAKASELGVSVDVTKIKTMEIPSKLHKVSVEKGVMGALAPFHQTWDNPMPQLARRLDVNLLEEVIKNAMTVSENPKLLISESGKVRIMALNPQE